MGINLLLCYKNISQSLEICTNKLPAKLKRGEIHCRKLSAKLKRGKYIVEKLPAELKQGKTLQIASR